MRFTFGQAFAQTHSVSRSPWRRTPMWYGISPRRLRMWRMSAVYCWCHWWFRDCITSCPALIVWSSKRRGVGDHV
jgi:hypothetical protein